MGNKKNESMYCLVVMLMIAFLIGLVFFGKITVAMILLYPFFGTVGYFVGRMDE